MDAYRSGRLVYIPIAKNASTSYRYVFHEDLGWEHITCDLINWDTDRVFGHLQHPYTRHTKGLAEAMFRYGFQDLVNDHRLRRLMATAVFDLHSYPLVPTLGEDWCYKIDWILLDHPKAKWEPESRSDVLTNKLFKEYGIDRDVTHYKRKYTSSKYKLALERQLTKIREENDPEDTLTHFYDRDIVLWNRVAQHTHYWDQDWRQVSWLRNYKK